MPDSESGKQTSARGGQTSERFKLLVQMVLCWVVLAPRRRSAHVRGPAGGRQRRRPDWRGPTTRWRLAHVHRPRQHRHAPGEIRRCQGETTKQMKLLCLTLGLRQRPHQLHPDFVLRRAAFLFDDFGIRRDHFHCLSFTDWRGGNLVWRQTTTDGLGPPTEG